jgi:hypothetical protein
MKSCSLTTLTNAMAVSLLTLFIAGRVLADDLPSFSESEVNTFVKSYALFVDDYVAAYKAAKSGVASKMQALQAKSPELQAQGARLAGKIKPDETEKYKAFITSCMQKIVAAAQQ